MLFDCRNFFGKDNFESFINKICVLNKFGNFWRVFISINLVEYVLV